ncbi:Chaperone protein HscC [hydrothermal vent metagenome]|uniref:Chaperone protein HscC n=1 Tax=hydrothermal vent metagenome TaxID=652676 RepID=A0A3B0XPC0_9ZZZZ
MAILGIDLGTTNCACAIWVNDGVQLIKNRLGDALTPSVVGLDDKGNVTVGRIAKDRLITHSDKTVAVFKRLMGTEHKIQIGKKYFTATELSSIILKSLKEDAENHLGESVDEAVISVPAYFNDNQRHATKLAGELVGFKVDRLINEPTAAAMAYGLHDNEEGVYLILDMGGGTFDVSILEFFEGVMEVHATSGDNFLGGEDFVEAMVDDMLNEIDVNKDTLNSQQLQTLYMQMETAKRKIGSVDAFKQTMTINSREYQWESTREWFERITLPLMLRVKRPIERALRDADLSSNDIDNVVLVGGATRMGVFRSSVGKLFGRLPLCHIDPDTVVAMGAAIQAGLKDKNEALNDIVLTDVCPYTLGTEINNPNGGGEGGYYYPIIERNTTVPTSIVKTVQTSFDNQVEVEIKIYQGENRLVKKNVFLGSLSVKVPKGPEGREKVDIRYSYDMNGLLEVDVTVASSGKIYNKLIEQTPGALSDKDKKASIAKLNKIKFHPRETEENRAVIAKGERIYETSLSEDREYIANILAQFDKILDRQNQQEIKKAREQLLSVLNEMDKEEWF